MIGDRRAQPQMKGQKLSQLNETVYAPGTNFLEILIFPCFPLQNFRFNTRGENYLPSDALFNYEAAYEAGKYV